MFSKLSFIHAPSMIHLNVVFSPSATISPKLSLICEIVSGRQRSPYMVRSIIVTHTSTAQRKQSREPSVPKLSVIQSSVLSTFHGTHAVQVTLDIAAASTTVLCFVCNDLWHATQTLPTTSFHLPTRDTVIRSFSVAKPRLSCTPPALCLS